MRVKKYKGVVCITLARIILDFIPYLSLTILLTEPVCLAYKNKLYEAANSVLAIRAVNVKNLIFSALIQINSSPARLREGGAAMFAANSINQNKAEMG
ncbi:MAG: hypothetical protein OEZ28_01235 [Nitrospinota bacterium]|nr:hypothetical protein [Nitrospinota bacterium]